MNSSWLKKRGEIILKYATSLSQKLDKVKITFDYPDCGWMPMHFHKNGIDMGYIALSDVYDSFVPLREWLETIATSSYEQASIINLDCEGFHAVLSYEPIWFYDENDINNATYPPDLGMFSVYSEADNDFILDALCETETFIREMYQCFINFAEAMKLRPEFIDDWVQQSFNEEWGELDNNIDAMNEIFLSKVKSKKIENYIQQMDNWHLSRRQYGDFRNNNINTENQ